MSGVGSDYLRRWGWGKGHKEKIHKQKGRRREVQELSRECSRTLGQRGRTRRIMAVFVVSVSQRLGTWSRVMKMGLGKWQTVISIANFTWRVKERSGQVTFQGCMFCQKTNEWYNWQTRKFIGNNGAKERQSWKYGHWQSPIEVHLRCCNYRKRIGGVHVTQNNKDVSARYGFCLVAGYKKPVRKGLVTTAIFMLLLLQQIYLARPITAVAHRSHS